MGCPCECRDYRGLIAKAGTTRVLIAKPKSRPKSAESMAASCRAWRSLWSNSICSFRPSPRLAQSSQTGSVRYIDPMLAAYVGETVLLRYDPRDVGEVWLFHQETLAEGNCVVARRDGRNLEAKLGADEQEPDTRPVR